MDIGYTYIDDDTYNEMDRSFGYSIGEVLANFSAFITYDYPNIISYYSGKTSEIDATAQTSYGTIRTAVYKAIADMVVNRDRMSLHAGYWDLQEILDEAKSCLDYISNLAKWMRSTTGSVATKTVTLGQSQTIESLAFDMGIPESEWSDLSINNGLMETDYTLSSGNELAIQSSNDAQPIQIEDVVDIMAGKAMYGKDIQSKITFDSVSNDLVLVEGSDCRDQLLDNAFKCTYGSVPEDLNFGYENLPNSKASYPIGSVVRQLTSVIMYDDTIDNVNLDNVSYQEDGYLVSLSITDKLGGVVQKILD